MSPIPMSVGKYRGMQQCATAAGGIAVLALDHRNNLRNAMDPGNPTAVTTTMMSAFKVAVIRALAPASSAVLLDPEVGAAQCVNARVLPGSTGLVVAVEATGYTGDPGARKSQVLPGWSVAKARRMGASAIKLLVYYHPDAPTAAEIEGLVRQVADDCQAADIPFFLEPLSYSPDPAAKKVPPEQRKAVVLETARRLVVPGVDVLKAEFPLDIKSSPDEGEWLAACRELSSASRAPWILLSASVDYDTYLRQVAVSCRAGGSGVAVGRAVWQEAPTLKGNELEEFLRKVARPRIQRLTDLVNEHAKPWTDFYLPQPVDDTWYQGY